MASHPTTPEPAPLKRSYASMAPHEVLGSMSEGADTEDMELEHESPDLGAYLDAFDVEPEDRIKMCRAYASYLSSQCAVAKKRARLQQ